MTKVRTTHLISLNQSEQTGAPSFAHFAKGGSQYCLYNFVGTALLAGAALAQSFWVAQRFSAAITIQEKGGFSR